MTLPFRRRSRPRGQARLALAGDFPGDQPVTDAINALPPDRSAVIFEDASGARLPAWDGTPWGGAGIGLPDGIAVIAIKQHGRDTQPIERIRAAGYRARDTRHQQPPPRWAPEPRDIIDDLCQAPIFRELAGLHFHGTEPRHCGARFDGEWPQRFAQAWRHRTADPGIRPPDFAIPAMDDLRRELAADYRRAVLTDGAL